MCDYKGGVASMSRATKSRPTSFSIPPQTRFNKPAPGLKQAVDRDIRTGLEVDKKAEVAEILATMEKIEVENAATALVDMKNFVEADISAAVDELIAPTSGGRKKKTGGSKSAPELKKLVAGVLNDGKAIASGVDTAFAAIVDKIPTMKQFVTGLLVSGAIRNPWFFTDVVRMVRDTLPSLIPVGASYADIAEEIRNVIVELARLVGDQGEYIAGSPEYALLLSGLIVRYLAQQQGLSSMDYLKLQAKYTLSVLGMAFNTFTDIANEVYSHATSDKAKQEKLLATLRGAVDKVARSKVTYEGVGPAAVPGLMVQKPSPVAMTEASAKRLANTLSKIVVTIPDTNEAANILASMAAAPPAPGAAQGGRRKTKKQAMKKRRMTRRKKLTFSY